MENNIDIFKQIDFLEPLSEEALLKVTSPFQEIVCSKGTVLFNENDVGDCFYIVKKGKVGLSKKLTSEENVTGELSFFSPYDYFGELALIDDESRSGTAIVSEDSVLLMICKEEFLSICKDYPEVMFNMVKTMSRRIRETNERYIKMWDQLIKKSQLAAVGSAASKIVHDIKNPITVMILTAQLIERIFDDSSEYSHKIVCQANRINDMVREILEFASGERTVINIEEVNLENLLSQIADDLGPVVKSREMSLIIVNNVTVPVKLNDEKIYRVLMNLIKNSMEALEGNLGTITIKAETKDNMLHLSVQDDGPGIPDALVENIFQPFVSFKKMSGTGLGLAICRKIIEDHKGQITAANLPEGGARFDITIPL